MDAKESKEVKVILVLEITDIGTESRYDYAELSSGERRKRTA